MLGTGAQSLDQSIEELRGLAKSTKNCWKVMHERQLSSGVGRPILLYVSLRT